MQFSDLAPQRLANQYLLQPANDPIGVVRALGAMQSQDHVGAKWALGMRVKGATDESITKLYNDGKILRTHILRPTWHFVAAEDIRWIQQLTAPRVHAFNKYYYKKLGLDEATIHTATEALVKALQGGNELTRDEVKEVYAKAGIETMALRSGYLVIHAELEAIVCSGAMRGKQHTLALVDERAPKAKTMTREAALAELTKRFFTAHGPATIQDFAWWSSLTTADIKQGIDLARLHSLQIEGKTFYYAQETKATIPSPLVHLLPNYDEYAIAYKERRPFMSTLPFTKQPTSIDLLFHFVFLDGQLVGGWKRKIDKKMFVVQLNEFVRFNASQLKALELVRQQLQDFVQMPVRIEHP